MGSEPTGTTGATAERRVAVARPTPSGRARPTKPLTAHRVTFRSLLSPELGGEGWIRTTGREARRLAPRHDPLVGMPPSRPVFGQWGPQRLVRLAIFVPRRLPLQESKSVRAFELVEWTDSNKATLDRNS